MLYLCNAFEIQERIRDTLLSTYRTALFELLFLLRCRKVPAGLTDKRGEIVTVIHICDIEIVFGSIIGLPHLYGPQQLPTRFRRLHKETIIADKSEDFTVTIDAVVTEHLTRRNLTCPTTLVGDVLNKI